MKYQALGDLKVFDHDAVLTIGAPKMESTLAALVIRANQVVSIDQLTDEIWGDSPPRLPTPVIHVYISNLRKLLARADRPESPIVTRPPGYLLAVDPEDVDHLVLRRLVGQGRQLFLRKRYEEAGGTFNAALDLWRGDVLSQLRDGPLVSGFVRSMEEARLECLELSVESNLMLDRHREVIGLLYELIAEHPLHEVFYGQLMRALHRGGRRGDALHVYRIAREVLSRELGLEPGRRLSELQRAVLRADDDHRVRIAA